MALTSKLDFEIKSMEIIDSMAVDHIGPIYEEY